MNTFAPCLARILAVANPIPDDPPVQSQITVGFRITMADL